MVRGPRTTDGSWLNSCRSANLSPLNITPNLSKCNNNNHNYFTTTYICVFRFLLAITQFVKHDYVSSSVLLHAESCGETHEISGSAF